MAAASLSELQLAFAAAIRDPVAQPIPTDVLPERMAVYQRLFFNNVASGIAGVFPVTHSLLETDVWQELVRAFWRDHRCREPQFMRMAGEFVEWLDTQPERLAELPRWLLDLLIWEYAELESMLALDDQPTPIANVMETSLFLSHSLGVFAFDYPVHRIATEWQPDEAETTFLACYRTPQDTIDFMQLTAGSYALLEQMLEQPELTGAQHCQRLAQHMALAPSAIEAFMAQFLNELVTRHIIVGTRHPSNP